MGDPRSCCAHAGVRRILAVTADKAEEAFKKAEALSQEVGALAAQEAPDEGAVKALVDRIDRDDSLPTTSRSEMKAQVRRHCSSVAYPHRKPHESY
jgi:alanyl-tRNA synthetase